MLSRRVFLSAAIAAPAAPAARVLLISGETDTEYHDWRELAPELKKILEEGGRCRVDRMDEPSVLGPGLLANYSAALVFYSGPRWGTEAERAFEEFVRGGNGVASVHGVSYGLLMGTVLGLDKKFHLVPGGGWAAWPKMLGATWAPEDIGHARRGLFRVRIRKEHPLSAGLPAEFVMDDELYHKMTLEPGVEVLATAWSDPAAGGTGRDEPVAWTTSFGRGRCFHTPLGHDLKAMAIPGFRALLRRGVEFTAGR